MTIDRISEADEQITDLGEALAGYGDAIAGYLRGEEAMGVVGQWEAVVIQSGGSWMDMEAENARRLRELELEKIWAAQA